MRRGEVRSWMGWAILALAVAATARAQEAPPTGPGDKAAPLQLNHGFAAEPAAHGNGHTSFEHEAEHESGGLFLRGSYLFLQPRRRALDFAIADPNTDARPQGSVESLPWHSGSGLRAGGGYFFGHSQWEVRAYYTYFHTNASRALTKPAGGTLYATLTHPGFVDAVDTAAGNTGLNYNLVDVELNRRIKLNESANVTL